MRTRDGIPNLSREEVIARLRDSGCADVAPYAALLQQSIWMRVDETAPPGVMESRFGGPAMMPDGFEWPTYTAEPYMGRDPNDDPQTFVLWYAKQQQLPMFLIAQLNLAELPVDSALPRAGLLSLFTDPFDGVWGHSKSDQQGLRVIYTPPEAFVSLLPHEMPDRRDHHGAFAEWAWPEYRIDYFLKWSFSDWEAVHRLADAEPYRDVDERVRETMQQVFGYSFGHFLLDGGMNHQSDPRRRALETWDPPEAIPDDCTYEQISEREEELDRRAAAEWTCIFSITSDDQLRPVVSDTGGLSFLIRKADLAARRFDRVWIERS